MQIPGTNTDCPCKVYPDEQVKQLFGLVQDEHESGQIRHKEDAMTR